MFVLLTLMETLQRQHFLGLLPLQLRRMMLLTTVLMDLLRLQGTICSRQLVFVSNQQEINMSGTYKLSYNNEYNLFWYTCRKHRWNAHVIKRREWLSLMYDSLDHWGGADDLITNNCRGSYCNGSFANQFSHLGNGMVLIAVAVDVRTTKGWNNHISKWRHY